MEGGLLDGWVEKAEKESGGAEKTTTYSVQGMSCRLVEPAPREAGLSATLQVCVCENDV